MSDSIIEVKNVTKIFKVPHERRNTLKEYFVNIFHPRDFEKMEVLKDVSFTVKRGEFLGIIGRNGSGKSTLLKIIAGILQPNEGTVIINGSIAPFLELGVGFQPDLSVRDNVYLYGAILGLSRDDVTRRFDNIIKFAELEKFVDQKLKNLSSGMQVRIAFATAIQAKADIFLVDEVLAVGDIAFQKKCSNVFKKMRQDGKTVLFVSHDLESIKRFCINAILLDEGGIINHGDAESVVHDYNKLGIQKEKKEIQNRFENIDGDRVTVTDVSVSDRYNTTRDIFKSKDQLIFKIKYSVREKIDMLQFGIGVYRIDNIYCFGVNTVHDGLTLDCKKGNGEISLLLDAKLLNGDYFINVVSFGADEKVPYQFLSRRLIFSIYDTIPYRGLVNCDHEWIIKS